MFDRLKKWWSGKFRQTPMENILNGAEFENIVRPWPIRAGRAMRRFWLNEWKWIIGISIAVIGAFGLFR